MAGVFQPNVFQNNVFQVEIAVLEGGVIWTPDYGFRIAPYNYVEIIDGPGLILPDPPPRRPEAISIGLFNRSSVPSDTSPYPGWEGITIPVNYVKGYVLNVNWAELQPDSAGQTFAVDTISDAIGEATTRGLQLKVRVFFGSNAPAWAKSIGGTPMTLVEPQSGNTMTVGRWWHADYIEAVRLFWEQFATLYNPSCGLDGPLREVSIAGAMTKFAEEDVRQNSNEANRNTYIAAGYTLDQDLAACRASIDAMYPLRCVAARANNPHQVANTRQNVAGTTVTLMKYARTQLGLYAALGNNSDRVAVGWPTVPMSLIYGAITNQGPPSYIQTAAETRVGDLYQTCQKAVGYGCTMIELPSGYTNTDNIGMTPAEFDTINAGLTANALALGYP